jgi:Ca-activated chloride channel family protein
VNAVAIAQPAIASMWARGHVRELEDRLASQPLHYGAAAAVTDLERRIVEVSLRHSVLCRYTAFVAVDTRVVNKDGRIHRVTQPVELPSGWEMPAAPRGVAGIYASGANIAMTPGIVPTRRGRATSRAAGELALAGSRGSPQPHGRFGATDRNPNLEGGLPLPLPELVAQRDARRTAPEIARSDAAGALVRLLAAGRSSAGKPGQAWTEQELHGLVERLADELRFLISRLTAPGVPPVDFAALSCLLADLRRGLESDEAPPLAVLADLYERAGHVLREFVDARPGRQPSVSAELRSGPEHRSAFWRPAAD